MDQITGHVLPPPVAHKAGMQQFPHVGINEILSCSTFLPEQEGSARSNVGLFLDLEEVSTLFSPGEMKKITPQKLKQQPIGAGIGYALFFVAADLS